jgi:hypothetical protein
LTFFSSSRAVSIAARPAPNNIKKGKYKCEREQINFTMKGTCSYIYKKEARND